MIKTKLFRLFKRATVFLDGTGIGRLPGVLALHSAIKKILSPGYIKIGGDTLFLDKQDSLSLSVFGFYSRNQVDFTKSLIKKGWTVVDVGAHIGYFTLIFSRLVGPRGKVFAFEPDKDNYRTLRRNIVGNGIRNIVTENCAVSEVNGKVKFSLSESSVRHKLIKSRESGDVSIVDSITLDSYFKGREKEVDLVKIDVEGVEYRVLEGMVDILKKNRKTSIVLEYAPAHLIEYGDSSSKLFGFLLKHGFFIYDLADIVGRKGNTDARSIVKKYKDNGLTNLFLTRRKRNEN